MHRFQTILLVKRHRYHRKQKSEHQKNTLKHSVYFLVPLLLVFILSLPVAAGVIYTRISRDLPPVTWLEIFLDRENGLLLYPTEFLARDGQSILYQHTNYGVERRFLSIDPNQEEFFSPYLIQFTIASVEPDFWNSPGFHANWLKNDPPQTIAEHLVSRLLLWEEESSWFTSLRMRLLAAQITKRYGRAQVLEWYLNSTSYGHLTIGADTAARLYFDKPASQLSMAEAALLVATVEKPAINPLDAEQASLENQKTFLDQLYQAGVLPIEDYQEALNADINFHTPPPPYPQIAKAFNQQVLNRLSRQYGLERVELGGLRVTTTLDIEKQTALSCTTRIQLNQLKGQPAQINGCQPASLLTTVLSTQTRLPQTLQASAILMEPATGQVLAYLGDDNGGQESAYTQQHQAGSLLTPLITVNAFARGFSPASQIWDIPASLPEDLSDFSQEVQQYQGPVRLRTAVIQDLLAPISQLYEQIGADLIWRTAQSFGLSNLSNEALNQLLYTHNSASLLEIAQFYGTFSTLGTRYGITSPETGTIEAVLYQRVESVDGRILFTFNQPDSASIVSQQLAYLVHDILQDDYERRSAYGYPNLLEIGRPTAAKYGKNFQQSEVWAIGYTPQYLSVVWFGLPQNEEGTKLDHKTAGAVWHAIMQWLHKDLPITAWEQPPGISEITVCARSGLLPTQECPTTISEKFADGSQPVSYDNLFQSFAINRETGLLATVFTPQELVEERTYMVLPENALMWAETANIQQPPKNYDSIQLTSPSENLIITQPEAYQYLSGNIQIRGTVDEANLQHFQVLVGAGLYPETWYQVGEEQTTSKRNSVLASWDTTEQKDGLYALRLQVVRNDLSIKNHTLQVSIDNTPPQITLIYPQENSIISKAFNGQFTLQAEIQDQIGIKSVTWMIDGQAIGKQTQMPYSYPVSLSSGKHTLQITAEDNAGNIIQSTQVEFTVE